MSSLDPGENKITSPLGVPNVPIAPVPPPVSTTSVKWMYPFCVMFIGEFWLNVAFVYMLSNAKPFVPIGVHSM